MYIRNTMHCTWIMTAFCFPILYSIFFLCIPLQIESSAETDRLALLAFKEKIAQDPFQILNSWNNSHSFCKWQGVTCSPRHRRVITLDLFSQGLVGSLSPYVGNLTFLRILDLGNNKFFGEIPPEIGRLYRLRTLALGNNSFVGNIPINISGCINLEKLFLSYNELEGKIPIELSSLSKLVSLVLHHNNLTGGIPPFIGNLSSLQVIDFTYNSLGGSIPSSVSHSKILTFLGLGANMLFGMVPPLLYNISSLDSLILPQNQLNGTLPHKTNLPNLQNFMIGMNQFSGTIPVSLFNASRLQRVDLSRNNFFGKVPTEIGHPKGLQVLKMRTNHLGNGQNDDLDFITALTNCTNLQMLHLADNHFGGALPNSISNLSNQLAQLYMGGNQIHGSIPPGIQKYRNLIALGMNDNFFTGSIPFSIGMLRNLQSLHLGGNKLSGQIPSSLGYMSHLYMINLSNNDLGGRFILDLTKCRFLQEIHLSNNNLSGTLPEEITDLSSSLLYLDLAHNSFIGSLPVQLGNFRNLRVLNISENRMFGEIPSSIGGCLSLVVLLLKGNFFQGRIPGTLKSLNELRILDLSMNNLSGEIPNDLGNQLSSQNLNLSFNNLEGAVPTDGVFRNVSAFSILGNHKLCGGVFELQLPACHSRRLNKGHMSSPLKVTLAVVISSIVVAFFWVVAIHCRRRPKEKPSAESISGERFRKISHRELHQATDGFSLANLIGMGRFGSVYKGVLNEYGGHVAVKVFHLVERGASKSFYTECNALRKIRHRNLVKILTVCSTVDSKGNEFKALILMFMPNGSLEHWLYPYSGGQYLTRSLSLFKRLNIAIDIASALDYLHNHCDTPIVHCDLKPSNVLLDEDMTAYVGDFGLTKFLPKSTSNFNESESSSISPKGTIGYIPPEYGTGAQVSTHGDVYSYGILLLEMFTGKRPTDEIFKDGLTLHDFSSMALPLRVMDIVDPRILSEKDNCGVIIKPAHQRDLNERVQECMICIIKVGVACSLQSQSERMGINDALLKLNLIKDVFFGNRETQSII